MVTAPVLATLRRPFVELPEAYEEVKSNIVPVVIELAVSSIGVWVEAVPQFHT